MWYKRQALAHLLASCLGMYLRFIISILLDVPTRSKLREGSKLKHATGQPVIALASLLSVFVAECGGMTILSATR
ncbi:hypothetical protein GGS24DRAFT_461081 [Hypoxylon argillaceum]|nr:hypothetical protein GGS24DRAFT_461081 [Hypoxylon argillaceum]